MDSISKSDHFKMEIEKRRKIIQRLNFLSKNAVSSKSEISDLGRQLSSLLVESRGVLLFLRTMVDEGGDDSSLNENWQKCESMANLISTRPRSLAIGGESYYENICQQLIDDEEIARRYSRFFVNVVRKLYSKCESSVEKQILSPIFVVIDSCFDKKAASLPTEEQLTAAIDRIKLLYVSTPIDPSFLESLRPDAAFRLMHILFDIRNAASYCRTALKEILGAFFENVSRNSAALLVENWILLKDRIPSNDRRSIRFSAGSTGGVAAIANDNREISDLQDRIELLQQLLDDVSKNVRARLFDDCLELVLGRDGRSVAEPSTSGSTIDEGTLDNFQTLSILSFIVSTIERDASLGSSNKKRMSKLLKTLLEKNADDESGGEEEDEELKTLKTQNLLLVLGIAGALFSSGDVSEEDAEGLTELQSTLQRISETHPIANVRSAAKDVHFSIFLSKASIDKHEVSASDSSTSEDRRQSNYEKAMLDLQDPLVPVRAHALIVLSNLIKSKDPATCSNIDLLISAFIERLEEEDSYIYLAAVNCLSAAGAYRPNVVLPILTAIFRNVDGVKEDNLERRLKIGEAIVKITRGLGELAPFYGNDLINVFLSLLRDGDDEIKASCLSNVAEICRLMSFKLNSHIRELFYCSQQLLRWEKSEIVRRSAMNLLALLTENGDDFLEVLDDLSAEFYRFVKNVYEHDDDHTVRLHAQQCLQNLGEHVKKFLNPLIVDMS